MLEKNMNSVCLLSMVMWLSLSCTFRLNKVFCENPHILWSLNRTNFAGVMHWDWGRLSFLEIAGDENKDTYTYDDDKR